MVRDLMLAWRQLCTKADLAASPFEYTYSVNRWEAAGCPGWRGLAAG